MFIGFYQDGDRGRLAAVSAFSPLKGSKLRAVYRNARFSARFQRSPPDF
ncbi:hypothetical protein IQ268_17850 [Oculatella sp. LEGE 06141]|nr:hypothetical protein [Oculatella sp. LEGE 06141]MBE9180428.1 hypothetical protein [Oculatella sp. LEGE 06141]